MSPLLSTISQSLTAAASTGKNSMSGRNGEALGLRRAPLRRNRWRRLGRWLPSIRAGGDVRSRMVRSLRVRERMLRRRGKHQSAWETYLLAQSLESSLARDQAAAARSARR